MSGGAFGKIRATLNIFFLFRYIEVMVGTHFIMLTQCYGLPFIEFKHKGQDCVACPSEMNRLFEDYKIETDDTIFCENVPAEAILDAQYSNPIKSMVGQNFHKNRFGGVDGQKFFESTVENHCMYVSGEPWDTQNETAKLKTIFTSHPQVTADGYILSKDHGMKFNVVHRSKFEMVRISLAISVFNENLLGSSSRN